MAMAAAFAPETWRREAPLHANEAAVLFVDAQNASLHREGVFWEQLPEKDKERQERYVDNMVRLQKASREKGVENVFTVIESLTKDGRDRSLDYKISGFNIPKGCFDAKVFEPIAPLEDEIVIPKTSCDVFVSTNIDYVLRNLGIRQLVIVGMLTDQCISSAVRHACDLGYLVTLVTDACFTLTEERHDGALRELKGFCRQRTTDELVQEISSLAVPSTSCSN